MQKYLTLREVSERLGNRSRSAIYTDISSGRLPQPIKLGGRIYWPENVLEAHVESLAKEIIKPANGPAPCRG